MEKDAGLQPTPGKVSRKKSRTESLDRSQQKETLIQPTPWMLLARKKKKERNLTLHLIKDKYNLNCFPSTLSTYWKVICTQKERKKRKRFCIINSKLVNKLCYMLQSGDLDIFSSKRKRKKEKRRKKKGTVERHLCLILPSGLIF